MSGGITFPDYFNLADYYLYDRLNEGLENKKAILFGDRSWTYGDVINRSRSLQAWMESFGLAREQRVLIILPDSPAFVWSIFATLGHGAVVTMANPQAAIEDLAYVCEYTRAPLIITIPSVAEALQLHKSEQVKGLLLVPEVDTFSDPEENIEIGETLIRSADSVLNLSEVVSANLNRSSKGMSNNISKSTTKRDDVAFWLFTSGSTGKPKAAVHSHRDFAFNTEVYAKATMGYQQDDITVSIPRLYFGYATGTNLLFPFAVGATTGLFSEHPSPETLMRFTKHYQATIVTNVPTMLSKILEYDGEVDLSSVRFHLSAGEALPPTLLRRFTERFKQDVFDGIGSAEMFHIYCSNRPGDIKPGSLGKVVDGYEIRILSEEAEGPGAEPLAAGEIGVMWVKGDSIAQCYFQDRDKSWQTFHGHCCRTGDLFKLDEQGYLYFSGRSGDLFKVSGIWLSPLEVEECLLQHPAVALCSVIPIQLEGLTKSKAIVVLREAFQGQDLAAALQQHVKENLSRYKYPRQVEFVDDLPRNDRGKIDRKLLIAGEN